MKSYRKTQPSSKKGQSLKASKTTSAKPKKLVPKRHISTKSRPITTSSRRSSSPFQSLIVHSASSLNHPSFLPKKSSTRHLSSNPTAEPFFSREVDAVYENFRLQEGIGIYVRRSIGRQPRKFTPFLLLDHFRIEEGSLKKGLGFHPHPHYNLATFTYILPTSKGGVKHMDHTGNVGLLSAGDTQYMSAGRGIVHSEMPATNDAVDGMQLWIALPPEAKTENPQYQEYRSDELPVGEKDGVKAKVIMGKALGVEAKIKSHTPTHYIHYTLQPGAEVKHEIPAHWSTFAYLLEGSGKFGSNDIEVKQYHTAFFKLGQDSEQSTLASNSVCPEEFELNLNQGVKFKAGPNGADIILVSGQPTDPSYKIIQHGPYIANSREEIQQVQMNFSRGLNGFEGAQEFIDNWRY